MFRFFRAKVLLPCILIQLSLLPAPALSQPFGLTTRVPVTGIQIPLNDPGSTGTIAIVRGLPNISFGAPTMISASPDGTNRLFIAEKAGIIRVVPNNDSATAATIFLDISTRVNQSGEQGLLGMAFDPDYATSGYFYVYYSANSGASRSVISRFRVTSNPNVANPASEQVVIEVPQPATYSNHKAGMIAFGLDNMLYIALGDGGGGGDPLGTGQNCTDMLGAILRIDPRGATPYQIPADNPYAGAGTYSCGQQVNAVSRRCGIDGTASGQICKELFAVGLRNPWRFTFDRDTGALWAGDVGQGAWEEVNLVRAGDNLGWSIFEGNANYSNPNNLPASQFDAPVQVYGRGSSGGYSITGGYVYRGSQLPSLFGKYIYGDYGSGNVWALEYDGTSVISNLRFGTLAGVVSFGEDRAGELLAVSINTGYLYRFIPGTPSGTPIPTLLSQTGLFSNLTTLQITAGGIEYDLNAPLWSDGASKRRWLLLPGTQQIGFDTTNNYTFPVGTAIVKHFELTTSPGVNRRLETRVFFRHTQGWAGYTYKWRSNGSDADLIFDSVTEGYTVSDPQAPGGTRSQDWYYPSRVDCLSCHTASTGRILGVRTKQINRNFNYPAATDNQLRSWNNIALFSTNIGSHAAYGAYPEYSDITQPVANRARAYLASNCAMCHNPSESRPGVIDLRYETAQSQTNLIDQRPLYGDVGISDAYRVRAGSPSQSVLRERMLHLGEFRMPPLASGLVDTSGVALITMWINSLTDSTSPAAPSGLSVVSTSP